MQRAKTFFYVSLGILAIAFAFHLGATSVRAQSPCQLDVAEVGTSGNASGVIGRTFQYTNDDGSSASVPVAIPGTERVLATDQGGPSGLQPTVILEDGEVLRWTGGPTWDSVGNLCPASAPAVRTTWGRIKADRR